MRAWCGVVFLGVLGACAPSPGSNPAPRRVITIGNPEGGFNRGGLGVGWVVSTVTLEGLTQVNTSVDGRPRPRLAESWTWENEGRRLRLKLRPNVVFHDGTALASTVAAEALRRAIAEPGNLALYPSLGDIMAVRPDGDLDLVLELSQPSAFIPEELDLPLSSGTEGIGTGPFRLMKRDASAIVLERFERYYLGAPDIEQIVIRPFDTLRAVWPRLLRGELDMVTDVPPDAVEFIRNDDIEVIPYARSYQYVIAFNLRQPVFRSSAARRALNVGIDRAALIANVLHGQGESSTGPIWPRHWAYDASIHPYTYDPRFATSLLDGAGFVPGAAPGNARLGPARLRFTCLLPADFSVLEGIGLEVQKQLYDLGVDMQVEVVSVPEYDARIREGRFDAILVDIISGPTLSRPYLFWGFPRREGLHAFGYDNSQAGRLFDLLRSSTNEAAIRSAVARLQRVMLDDPPALFLAWNQRARAVRRDFRVVSEAGRDPLLTIWQWTDNSDRPSVSTQ